MIHKSIIFWITSYVLIIPFFGFAQSNQSIPVQLYPRLIPYPNHVTIHGEETLDTLYIHPSEKANGMPFFEKIINHPNVVWTSHKTNYIARLEPTLCKECYGLYITSSGIELIGGTQHALHLAQMTLLQLISIEGFPLRHLTIEDSPRFSYRGMHLDVCRHFFDVESIKKYLDFMSYYKYNYFHWHLTEDQGWRIEIKKYPKLQSIAAYRDETLVGHYNDTPHTFDGEKYGGFYTQDQIRDIIKYASKRGITIIPEIEMPGHSMAALAAYPELACEPGPYSVATKWGVFEDVYCPSEATFTFLENVLDEVIDLFPGPYIHIGGDECPKTKWKNSQLCQDLIKKEGLADEHALQSYFIKRIEKYINSKGKKIIGWDEILEGGLAPNATVMSWRGIQGGIEAAHMHHDVIMTPGSHCYFDHYQDLSDQEPIAIGGYTPIEKVYRWDPIPDELNAQQSTYVIGGQANLWTEYIPSFDQLTYMACARGTALSSVLWGTNNDFERFSQSYFAHSALWKDLGYSMADHIYHLKIDSFSKSNKGTYVSLSYPSGSIITVLHEDTLLTSYPIEKGFLAHKKGKYSLSCQYKGKKQNQLHFNYITHNGIQASLIHSTPPSQPYNTKGTEVIHNGIQGSMDRYGDSEWLGYSGTDAVFVFDFGQSKHINKCQTRFFNAEGQWIYLPKNIAISTSQDGHTFSPITTVDITSDAHTKVATVDIPLPYTTARYLKIHIENYGIIPESKQGGGHPSWMFIDEIIID